MSNIRTLSDLSVAEVEQAKTIALVPPEWLPDDALEHWHTLSRRMLAHNLVNDLDIDALAIYCNLYARYVAIEREMNDEITQKTQSGYEQLRATFVAWRQLSGDLLKYANRLGLTPQSRASLKMQTPEPADDFDKI